MEGYTLVPRHHPQYVSNSRVTVSADPVAVPIILKGIGTAEDAILAYESGVQGIVLSNHGGRQLDFARSGIEVLVEVVEKFGEKRGISFPNEKFQLFVDGGVRRASDVIKAVALGATAGMSHSAVPGFYCLLTDVGFY